MQEQFEEITFSTFLSFSWLVTFYHENHHSKTGADLATRVFIILIIIAIIIIIVIIIVVIVAIVLIVLTVLIIVFSGADWEDEEMCKCRFRLMQTRETPQCLK